MVESEDSDSGEQRIRHVDLRNELGLSMVFIRESTNFAKDDLAIFPPINHENLYVDGLKSPSESSSLSSSSRLSDSSSSSPSSLSPSHSDKQCDFDRNLHSQPSETVGKSRSKSFYYSIPEIAIVHGRWKLLLARLLSNFQKLMTCFSRSRLCSSRSFYPVMVIVIWWWMRYRTRRRLRHGEILGHLTDTIKDRDERIAQLLHQIAQMNELLVKIAHSN